MKVKAYMKVAKALSGKKGYKVEAAVNKSFIPLKKASYGYNQTILPTVFFCVEFDIDDKLFEPSERLVANIKITSEEGYKIYGKQVQYEIQDAIDKVVEPIISKAALKSLKK